MMKTLPKGHLSCLSNAFRYTPAAHTNVASTFARIKRELKGRRAAASGSLGRVEPLPVFGVRRFPPETIESAWRRLQPAPRLEL